MWTNAMSKKEVADLVERFLNHRSSYPQEWNDFVETAQRDNSVNAYRLRCYELDPLVNRPGLPDEGAVFELRSIIEELRNGRSDES